MATLQQQVQQYLQNTGISLRELSRRSGVSHTTIGKILRGGEYKSGTAHALYSLISITPIGEYVTLHDKVEQLAADRVDHDKGAWDTDLQCAKYRRVMQLEQQLNDANTAYLSSKSQHERDLQRLSDANAEIKRLTTLCSEQKQNERNLGELYRQEYKKHMDLSETIGELKQQLDHGQTAYNKIYAQYSQQVDDEREMLAQIDNLFAERDNTATKHDQQVMRLRVYVWILIAALVFVVASGLVLWGAV